MSAADRGGTLPAADLHLHTTYSDGVDTPEEVVEKAARAGLSVISITDHDNVEAFPRSAAAAAKAGITLLPGIEMSAAFDGIEVHILGFLFDRENPELLGHLKIQQARRVERVHETVKRLGKVGVFISAKEVLELAGEGTVGRPHVARILHKRGYVSTPAEAFERYIGNNGPGFIPGSTVEPAAIFSLIRQASGIPVLAHPIYLKRDELIDRFAKEGLEGVEVYHSSHTPEVIRRYDAIAARLGLIRTGGSDYHGEAHKEGVVIGAVRLDLSHIDALKARHAKLFSAA